MSEKVKVTREEFVAAIRNNSKDGSWVKGRLISEMFGISANTVMKYARRWNELHPEDPIIALRGYGYKMGPKPVAAEPETKPRYADNKTEEGYPDPTATAAMKDEQGPIKSYTLWLTRESETSFAYFAVLRATKTGAVGFRFDKVEGHRYIDEIETPGYISSDGVKENDLICDFARPTFKRLKYMVEKVRDLERTEVRTMAKAVADLFGTDYFLRQQLAEKTREIVVLNSRIESLKKKQTEASTEIVKPAVYPVTTAPISDKDLAILKAQYEIYKTFFDRMTSGDNLNATIRVTKEGD